MKRKVNKKLLSNESEIQILGFSNRDVETKNLIKKASHSLKLRRNIYEAVAVISSVSAGYLIGVTSVSYAHENPALVCWSSFIGASILVANALCLENSSEKIEKKLQKEAQT